MEPNVWYKQTGENILAGLVSSREGLSTDEASRRLIKNGTNELRESEKVCPFRIFLSRLKHLSFWILIVALLISLFLGAWTVVFSIILVAGMYLSIGFAEDLRARKSIARAERLASKKASVYRDGQIRSVPSSVIVAGDVIVLDKGDYVAADARIIESSSLSCAESAVTGEQGSVEKNSSALEEDDLPPKDRENMVFMGTRVTHGTAVAVVVTTALNTVLGRIPKAVRTKEARTMGRILLEMTILIGILLFLSVLLFFGMLLLI